ncbi:MAG: hypothetical protein KKD44_20495 [Proteobacteria bacterium]|nr:hypothetical protein [Pseudomonadota bacterium]
MKHTPIIKNIMVYNKAGFENAFNSLVVLQNQAESYIETAFKQNSLIPDEGKSLMKSWLQLVKNTQESARHALLNNHERIKSFMDSMTS